MRPSTIESHRVQISRTKIRPGGTGLHWCLPGVLNDAMASVANRVTKHVWHRLGNVFFTTGFRPRALTLATRTLNNSGSKWNWIQNSKLQTARGMHTSTVNFGIEEFFEAPDKIGKTRIKSAAPWSCDLLRVKSNEDLHKLWFILLKERNMLETMQYHYESVDEPMPSPERLEKVAESMSNLRDVLEEREKAQNMLILGRPKQAHGEYRKSGLGATYWYEYKENLLPKHLAKEEDLYGDKPADIATFDHRLEEWHLRYQEKRMRVAKKRAVALGIKWRNVRRRRPDLPVKPPAWWISKFKTTYRYGIHPMLPVIF